MSLSHGVVCTFCICYCFRGNRHITFWLWPFSSRHVYRTEFPWFSLAIPPGKSSNVCTELINVSFYLSVNTDVAMWRSTQENIAYKFVLLISSAQYVLFILPGSFVRWEVNGHTAAVLSNAASRISSEKHTTSLCSSYLAFSPNITLATEWHDHTVVLTQLIIFCTLYFFICAQDFWPYVSLQNKKRVLVEIYSLKFN